MSKENESTTPETGAQPGAEARGVSFEVTLNGETRTEQVRFNTPLLLKRAEAVEAEATIKIVATPPDGSQPVTLVEGTRDEVVTALKASILPADKLSEHIRAFIRTIADHSTLKAISVSAVCTDADGADAGFGFYSTTVDCTVAEAIALVNCCDANTDEFVAKAKLQVPGRAQTPGKDGIVVPTPEQVKALG